MTQALLQQGMFRNAVLPFLFGFLLLGGLGHPVRHGRDHAAAGAPAAAPAQRPAAMPRQLRAFADNEAAMQDIAPLPTYVLEQDPRGAADGSRSWSI
jgi:hypothetical protein